MGEAWKTTQEKAARVLACPGLQRTSGAARRMCKKCQNPVRRRMRERQRFHWCRLEIMTILFVFHIVTHTSLLIAYLTRYETRVLEDVF